MCSSVYFMDIDCEKKYRQFDEEEYTFEDFKRDIDSLFDAQRETDDKIEGAKRNSNDNLQEQGIKMHKVSHKANNSYQRSQEDKQSGRVEMFL